MVGHPRAWVWALAAGGISVAIFLLTPHDGSVQVASFFVPLLLSVVLLAAGTKATEVRSGGALPLLLAAQLGYLLTTLVWYVAPVKLGQQLPFPSWVDGAYMVVYLSYAAFLLAVLRRRSQNRAAESRIAVIDAMILTVSMAAVLWVAVIEPSLMHGTSLVPTVVAVMYPGLTLLLFALAARLAIGSDLRRSVPGVLVLVWIGAEIAADTFYGFQSANGTFAHGNALSALWMVSYTALAALAAHPGTVKLLTSSAPPLAETDSGRSRDFGRAARLLLLLSAALLSVGLAYIDSPHRVVLLGASMVAVTLVTYRTSLLAADLHSERRLAAELDVAMQRLQSQHDQLELQARELERLSLRDSVTGLGNRTLLHKRAADVGRSLKDTTLVLLDLDGFKEVNDTLGHAAGDTLLLEVGDRLGRCVRTSDTVVRLGGDEFAVLLAESGRMAAVRTADRILCELREPFQADGVAVQVRGSIGIASGTTASSLDEMLRNADLAMYQAKSAGRDQACEYHPDMYTRAARRLALDAEVRAAVAEGGDFVVYFQPIVTAATGEVHAVEALVRWNHPHRGVLLPAEFLPAVERTGQIVELGRFVLRTACHQLARWRQLWPELCVAVNVAHQELLAPGFTDHVTAVLAETGLPAPALHLEVTENVLVSEDRVAQILKPLADLGVRLSIDDFGTGASSLSRLRSLSVSRLKIERSFIAEITEAEPDNAPLLTSIIALAHSVGQIVVAEGVETAEQAAFLAAHGCDELQGYLFSRPVEAGQVGSTLLGAGTPSLDDQDAVRAPGSVAVAVRDQQRTA